jgi:Flp pilus assembly secretin CpaC
LLLGPGMHLLILFVLLKLQSLAATLEKPPIVLAIGEQRILTIPNLHRYSLGSPNIRILPLSKALKQSLKSDEKNILLMRGVKPGISDLWVWKTDGASEHRSIQIERSSRSTKNLDFEKALGSLNEVEVIPSSRGTVLRGKIYTPEECSKISHLQRTFPAWIHDETQVSEPLLEQSQEKLTAWLKASHFSPRLKIDVVGSSLFLRGTLDRPAELATVEKQARAIFPLILFDISTLPDSAPTIYFRVFLLELKRSEFHSLGISWPGSVPGAFQITSAGIQNLVQIDLTLKALESKGSARLLSNPELVVRAPGEAELFAGGEFPIKIQTRFTSTVLWKNYGLTLRLRVTHTNGDRVRLDISTEVSQLDHHIAQENIPGIQSNRMKTQVDAQFETPLLLSGLLQQGVREDAKGIPFLRSIPVLGLLFGSEDYLNERSELVAILYPHLSPPKPLPLQKIHRFMPRGPLPTPREWVSPDLEQELRESHDFPWNALK